MDPIDFNRELHARPSIYFDGPALVCHAAYMGGSDAHPLYHEQSGGMNGRLRLAREMHAEFHTLTSVVELTHNPSSWPVAPRESLEGVTNAGTVMMRVQILVLSETEGEEAGIDAAALERFGMIQPVASTVGGGDATIYSDFRVDTTGFGRILLVNRSLNAYRLGRMVRRLYEIETYRAMALLGLPLAREASAALPRFDERLVALSEQSVGSSKTDPRELLDRLSELSSELSRTIARVSHRFGATRAYAEIVEERIRELRETRATGFQRFGTFIDRRFRPAVRTCGATERRLDKLAANVAQLVSLLQTRVQVGLQEQNVQRLQGMEARTATQIKIQKAVEGLSVIAITYYAASLVKLSLEALDHSELVSTGSWMLVALPMTLFAVIAAVLMVRRALK
ncbi:putative membrane-anchored protein [Pseudochelatococcus lubricantis]|uniref:Membrane-anchored protein n=1 Tax=Pseudochelatococcus lubricantis TaxID=1538102 RepID=A0ABX0V3J8_9HYPH|nr:DUF3422 domain-containing protein [Pseudochelatococcus lubricantis]NIJ58940.1 putative membrane-anchored protein [Pseudochelatococcus lubricantis]